MSAPLRAAVGRRDITPPVGMPASGWSNQAHEVSEGNDLELWATVLVVEDGEGHRVAIADLDLCLLADEQARRARETISAAAEIPLERVTVGTTHIHCGPATGGIIGSWIRQGREQVEPYVERVIEALADAAVEAASSLRPVRVGSATGSSPLAVNRRMQTPSGAPIVGIAEQGPLDRTLTVVRLDGEDGRPVATIVHYAAHPIILGADNRVVTPEYPGVVKRVVESSLGGRCLFIQGACGDIGPRELFVGDLDVYRRLGAMVGHEAAGVAWRASWRAHRQRLRESWEKSAWIATFEYEPDVEPDATLASASELVAMPLTDDLGDPGEWTATATRCEDELYAARSAGAPADEIRELTVRTKFAVMRAERAIALHGLDAYPLLVQGVRIGPVAMVGVPVEIFIETGNSIRDASPFPTTLVSGFWNGYRNYLPTDVERVRGGYEVEISPFRPGGPTLVAEGAARVLDSLASADG